MAEIKHVEQVDIDKLIPYVNNAKIHSETQITKIASSIREFGFVNPVLIDKDFNIIAGHGRVMAAKKLDMTQVPCLYVEGLTEAQRKAYILADNRLGELAEWDMELVTSELEMLQELDFDIDLTGFELPETEDDTEIEEDEYPEEVETRCKKGDIWQLGKHRLICGDSTDQSIIDALMDGAEADLLLTDPPYNVNVGQCERPYSPNNEQYIKNDHMEEGTFIDFLTSALYNAKTHMRGGAAYYIWYAGLHHIEFESALRRIEEFKLHEQLIWVKTHFVLGRNSDYQWMHECCLYGWKTGAPHYFTDSRAESTVIEDTNRKLNTLKKEELIQLCEHLMGQDKSTTILHAEKPMSAELHPTVKPQGLLAPLLINSSKRGDKVLDLFGGSGSTLIACEQLGRTCFMCELDPHYADVIIQRWESLTKEKAVLMNE